MKLLVSGSAIIAASSAFTATASDVHSPDAIYPLSVIGNYQIVDLPALPVDFTSAGYLWVDNALQRKPDDPSALAAARQATLDALEVQRQSVQNMGCLYTFPDVAGHIQTRTDSQDLLNINGQVTAALVMKTLGQTSAQIPFRDAENATHLLTPDQMITAGMSAQAFVSKVYETKWNKAAEIDTLTSISATKGYDLTTGWPG